MSQAKKISKKRTKSDTERRLESILDIFSFAALFNVTLAVLYNVISLIILRTADVFIPFKLLVLTGFIMLASVSVSSIYFHVTEKRFQEPRLLCVKVITAVASVATMLYGIGSVLFLEAWLTLNFTFNAQTILALGVGILAAIIGLSSAFLRRRSA